MNYGLSDEQLSVILSEIKKNLGSTVLPEIFLFGSRVKGNYRPFSDLDILLKAQSYDEHSLDLIDFSNLDTPFKVDFVLDTNLYEGYRDEIYDHMVRIG
ncbi:MAG: hypothetical protein CME65_08320 [Halobacteriovoraceae bacterium]|nr:hypothetical protein [Halobacteriovoraceae bacterium]|tara:strand:+ start:2612 stop:2908 length:297 start_codon:yes stop_codon:yes gene_type:complete